MEGDSRTSGSAKKRSFILLKTVGLYLEAMIRLLMKLRVSKETFKDILCSMDTYACVSFHMKTKNMKNFIIITRIMIFIMFIWAPGTSRLMPK